MLNKLEFEVQKYGRDITYYVETHKILHKKSWSNILFLIFISFTIFLILSGILINNYISHPYFYGSSNIFTNAFIYSSLALFLTLIIQCLYVFIRSLHPKEFSEQVIKASSPASVMDMDKYKDLVLSTTKVNHSTDIRIKTLYPIIAVLKFVSIVLILLTYVLIIESILIYSNILPQYVSDLFKYIILLK